jgi:hypothetical protein
MILGVYKIKIKTVYGHTPPERDRDRLFLVCVCVRVIIPTVEETFNLYTYIDEREKKEKKDRDIEDGRPVFRTSPCVIASSPR